MYPVDGNKRKLLRQAAVLAQSACLLGTPSISLSADRRNNEILLRKIPSTGRSISAVGMGSWLTFDLDPYGEAFTSRLEILKAFFNGGGQFIDSSPMYGQAEEVIGRCLQELKFPGKLFSATKVWTTGESRGMQQMQESSDLWKTKKFNLMQVHNLVDWQTHMKTLLAWKEKGQVEHIGITTYGGLRHSEMLKIMQNYPIDFVQLTYNILDREAEERLLPLAQSRGIAVIANRPFQGGSLFHRVQRRRLPDWVRTYNCDTWSQYFLKFILAHPAITCAIPATSQLAHMQQNIAALKGPLPTMADREKMIRDF